MSPGISPAQMHMVGLRNQCLSGKNVCTCTICGKRMSLLVKVQASFSCTSGRVGRSGKYDLSEFRGHKVRKGCEKRDHVVNDVMNELL